MKRSLVAFLFVVTGMVLCGNVLALDTYIPHITTGSNDWTDYLQLNNNASSTATFTLTLYSSSGAQIYNQTHSVGARSRSQIALKTLNASAATGKITYSETGLVFRVSYESAGGGVAEFKTIDTLGSNIGFCFSDFSTLVQWKGAAIANMGTTAADITLYALGGSTQGSGGSILETHTETIAPKAKLVGNNMNFSWLSGLDLSRIESIIAVAGSSSLCGIAISGNMTSSQLLFTPATPVFNFNPPAGGVAKYAGSYSGTYSGADFGTWSATANSAGNISGAYHSNTSGLTHSVSGTVSSTGTVTMATGGTSEGATFSGTIDGSGNWSGTWTNSLYATSGTFTGGRAPTDFSRYSGTWTVNAAPTGGSPGTQCPTTSLNWQLAVTPAGIVTGTIIGDVCGAFSSGAFLGNILTVSSNNRSWNHNGVVCCTASSTFTYTFSDENHAAGSGRVDDCPGQGGSWCTFDVTLVKK
jgi:hypothetical protein